MADISRYPFFRHLRAESSVHVLHQSGGRRVRAGRGLTFWFMPMSASIAEIPMDDRELPILFHGRSSDFQDVTVQAVLTWRVGDPEQLAERADFTIDLATGAWLKQPLEKLGGLLSEMAQQLAWDVIARSPVQGLLVTGVDAVRKRLSEGLGGDPALAAMGLAIVSVRVASIAPSSEVAKALQTPAREAIQMASDRATFERRANAVERERAIAENELRNRIELARQAEELIGQEGQNARQKAEHSAEEQRIGAAAAAGRKRLEDTAQAEGIRVVETAKVEAEKARMDVYAVLPPSVLQGLALRELAGNLPDIEHLSLGADVFGPVLRRLAEAGTSALEAR